MPVNELPLLGLLQLVPVAGAMLLSRIRQDTTAKWIGLGVGLLELGLAIWLYQLFDTDNPAWQWTERFPVAGPLTYLVGADGFTVLFILLTAFLTLLVAAYGGMVRHFTPLPRFLAVVFASEAALMAQFATLDLLWFTLMSLAHTLFVGHLLATWAISPDERPAINRYYQFMGLSLLLMLGATMILGWNHAAGTESGWRFDLPSLLADHRSSYLQSIIFYLLFYGLAIRIPMFPLHGWLPMVAERGTVASAMVLLLGLKSGIYGMLRFLFPLLPDAVWKWHGYVIAFAAVGIFYAALLALVQNNLRKLLAYAVISHTGVLVIGLFSLQSHSFQGGAILASTFGLAISTLLMMAGIVYIRTNTMLLVQLGGLFDHLPIIGVAFFIAGLAVVGMPGTPGFAAVHLILEAAIDRFGSLVTITAALGNVAAAACLLWAFQRAFLAPRAAQHKMMEAIPPATLAEKGIAITLIAVQLVAGFYSDPWLHLVKQSAHTLAAPYAEREARP